MSTAQPRSYVSVPRLSGSRSICGSIIGTTCGSATSRPPSELTDPNRANARRMAGALHFDGFGPRPCSGLEHLAHPLGRERHIVEPLAGELCERIRDRRHDPRRAGLAETGWVSVAVDEG